MTSITRLVSVVAGFVLMLNVTPSWGQPVCVAPGCNPTVSGSGSNTAGGTNALKSVAGGINNTAFGFGALQLDTTGGNNTSVGWQALVSNTSGASNTATGSGALFVNTTGINNTATGNNALESNNGNHNTATGFNALAQNAGNKNTAMGGSTLSSNTSGNNNTAIGYTALGGNSDGTKNTAVGFKALNLSTGSQNIGIGSKAGIHLQSGNNNIYLGSPGDPAVSTESLTMRLGSVQQTTFIAGINSASVSDAQVMIDTLTGQLGIATSSARYKQDIASMGTRSEKVLDLRPITFAYRDDARAITHYGLIAEEVATVYPELVTRTASGEVQTVKYQELIPMLLNELQRQHQALQSQQQELAELRALIGQGRAKVVLGGTGE